MLYSIGQKPGRGIYECVNCMRWRVRLDNDDDRLPPCGHCGRGQHIRYRRVA